MSLEFGNFKAVIAGWPKTAVVFNNYEKRFEHLQIEGRTLEFMDVDVIDTPRLPTIYWSNWAIAKARETILGLNRVKNMDTNGNELVFSFDVDASRPQVHIIFKVDGKAENYIIQIMDFILRYTFTSSQSLINLSLVDHFKNQKSS